MNKIFLWLIILHLIFRNGVMCQRRVVGGQRVDKRYAVYLVPSFEVLPSDRQSSAYFCGGAIISPSFIITSAACIHYNERKWVIAGYNKYLTRRDLIDDTCAQRYARKIVYECSHGESGNSDHTDHLIEVHNWRRGDIGIAKVERPFNFQDEGYYKYCSYPPDAIKFITVRESVITGADVMVLGWGSKRFQRPMGYEYDNNEKYLMAATTVVGDSKRCKEVYEKSLPSGKHVDDVFDKYTICTEGFSDVSVHGTYTTPSSNPDGRRYGSNRTFKFEDLYIYHQTASDTITFYSTTGNKTLNSTRRSASDPGPCQNDHGGPLVVWFGGREYLAGVAAAFLVNENMECMGPYLYTSISCAAKFLNCSMTREVDVRRKYQDACSDVVEDETDLEKPLESPNKTQDYWLYSD